MKRRTVLTMLTLLFSCTGAEKKTMLPCTTKPVFLPEVSGEISLEFERMLGGDLKNVSPWGMSFGMDGTLYLCDRDNAGIVRLDCNGNIVASFSGLDSRIGPRFIPSDMSVSGGIEVYALDSVNARILRLDRNLKNAYTIYQPDSNNIRAEMFGTFGGLAFDLTTGDLFVTDRDNGTVIRIDMLGGNIHTSGKFGAERRSLNEPRGIDTGLDGAIYIANRGSGVIGVLPHFGGSLSFIGKGVLEAPADVAALPEGRLAVADRQGILILDRAGSPLALAGYGTDRDMSPRSVAFYGGELYISDAITSNVLVYGMK